MTLTNANHLGHTDTGEDRAGNAGTMPHHPTNQEGHTRLVTAA